MNILVNSSIAALVLLSSAVSSQAQEEDTLPVGAVAERSVAASKSISEVRPAGEVRIWAFFAKGTTFGSLNSSAKPGPEIDGESSLALEERLELDYSQLGSERMDYVAGTTYLSGNGTYLGSNLELGPPESSEDFELRRDEDQLTGYFTRSGTENDLDIPYPREYHAWDANFVDQLEVMLAMRDLSIGTRIEDTVFSPQSLLMLPVSGEVIYFMWQEIYQGRIDSVFIIRLNQPAEYQLYFTPDKRLVRVDDINQNIRMYQNIIRAPRPIAQTEPGGSVLPPLDSPVTWRALLFKVPHYLLYAIAAGLGLLMFARFGFSWKGGYAGLVLGIGLYTLVPLVLNPLVIQVVARLLPEGGIEGGGAYMLAAVAPLMGGIFVAALITLAVWAFTRVVISKENRELTFGAFVGGGLGLAEACYQSGLIITPLWGWDGIGQAMTVLFHVAAGALIGGAFARGASHVIAAAVAAATVKAAITYLPFLPQQKVADIGLVHILIAAITLAFMAAVLLMLRRRPT